MAKKDRKPETRLRPTKLDPAYEKALIEKKELLEHVIRKLGGTGESQDLQNIIGLSAASALFVFLDMTVLGGIGTATTLGCTYIFSKARRQRVKLEKELEDINEDLKAYQKIKEAGAADKPKNLPQPVKDTFRKTVVPDSKVDALQRKMDALQKKNKGSDDAPKSP